MTDPVANTKEGAIMPTACTLSHQGGVHGHYKGCTGRPGAILVPLESYSKGLSNAAKGEKMYTSCAEI